MCFSRRRVCVYGYRRGDAQTIVPQLEPRMNEWMNEAADEQSCRWRCPLGLCSTTNDIKISLIGEKLSTSRKSFLLRCLRRFESCWRGSQSVQFGDKQINLWDLSGCLFKFSNLWDVKLCFHVNTAWKVTLDKLIASALQQNRSHLFS